MDVTFNMKSPFSRSFYFGVRALGLWARDGGRSRVLAGDYFGGVFKRSSFCLSSSSLLPGFAELAFRRQR